MFAPGLAVIVMVPSTVHDDVLCARYTATCWLTLLTTVRLAVVDKVPCGMAVLVQVRSSARETYLPTPGGKMLADKIYAGFKFRE